MSLKLLSNRLEFFRETEYLKDVLRSAYTSSGRPEGTAEHSWRLCLMALAFENQLAGLDLGKVPRMCVVHDLGEAIHGGIPTVEQATHPDKGEQERTDLLQLARHLDAPLRDRLLALWDEYEHGETAEALTVKAPDKLETLLQHTQGNNPADFDYVFNLDHDRRYTDRAPLFKILHELLDARTRQRLAAWRDAQHAPARAALPAPPPTQLTMATGKQLARFPPTGACPTRLSKGAP